MSIDDSTKLICETDIEDILAYMFTKHPVLIENESVYLNYALLSTHFILKFRLD